MSLAAHSTFRRVKLPRLPRVSVSRFTPHFRATNFKDVWMTSPNDCDIETQFFSPDPELDYCRNVRHQKDQAPDFVSSSYPRKPCLSQQPGPGQCLPRAAPDQTPQHTHSCAPLGNAHKIPQTHFAICREIAEITSLV